jgi:hypothetical protein
MALPGWVRASDDVVSQLLGDEMVLLNLKTGVYWGLNRTGDAIQWCWPWRPSQLGKTTCARPEKTGAKRTGK